MVGFAYFYRMIFEYCYFCCIFYSLLSVKIKILYRFTFFIGKIIIDHNARLHIGKIFIFAVLQMNPGIFLSNLEFSCLPTFMSMLTVYRPIRTKERLYTEHKQNESPENMEHSSNIILLLLVFLAFTTNPVLFYDNQHFLGNERTILVIDRL